MIDIKDLSYLYTPHNLPYTLRSKVGLPKPGIWIRFLAFWWQFVRQIHVLSWKEASQPTKILLFAMTRNQERALTPLMQHLSDVSFWGIRGFGREQLPLFWAYLLAVPFLPHVLWLWWQAKPSERSAFRWVWDEYWLAYGYIILCRRLLKRAQPDVLVVSNDHLMYTRALVQVAHELKIQTIYIQHASVTERFPQLNFSVALLEGKDSLQKYWSIGETETAVYLIGIPRFDNYSGTLRQSNTLSYLGICIGLMDNFQQIDSLCQQVKESLPNINVTIRPHPGDTRKRDWQALAQQYGYLFSDGASELPFAFLQKVDAIIAGDSNIHLEAALMNVTPIYYDFAQEKLDWYGFHEQGLVTYFDDIPTMLQQLHLLQVTRPSVREKARFYSATVSTQFDGRSTELASAIIQKKANMQAHDKARWQQISGFPYAYQLRETHV